MIADPLITALKTACTDTEQNAERTRMRIALERLRSDPDERVRIDELARDLDRYEQTDIEAGPTSQTDSELIDSVRRGDRSAAAELYGRHHAAASRLARSYARLFGDPDILVDEAFRRIFDALGRGAGPTASFRAYLFVTIRRTAMSVARQAAGSDEISSDKAAVAPERESDQRVTTVDPVTDVDMVSVAFHDLPKASRTVLWQTAIEGRSAAQVAAATGMSPNAAAELAYRARERLRQAYLQAHLRSGPDTACEPHRSRLGGYVRAGLNRRHEAATRAHVEQCPRCRALVEELSDINRLLLR